MAGSQRDQTELPTPQRMDECARSGQEEWRVPQGALQLYFLGWSDPGNAHSLQ